MKVYLRETRKKMRRGGPGPSPARGPPPVTYSRYLAQLAGSDMAMKQQLVRMVHMMKRLNKVLKFRRTTSPTALC